MSKVLTYVTIAGTNITSFVLSWNVTDTFGDEIPDAKIVFGKNILVSYPSILNGQEVIIKRGYTTGQEETVFDGYIDEINKNKSIVEITAKNKLIKLVKSNVNNTYDKNIDSQAGVGSAIMIDLITTYGDLSADTTSVISTGSIIIIDKFFCKKTDVFERLRMLCNVFDYQIYYSYSDNKVHCEPIGYTSNTNVLTVGTTVANVPKWEKDSSQLINQIEVDGAEQLVETTESGRIGVTSGYTTTDVTLLNIPYSVKVYANSSNPPTTLRTGGVPNSTITFDYYVDNNVRKIVWNSGTYNPPANDYVEVRYSYPAPIPVIQKRQSSIDLYGLSETIKKFSDIHTVEDAIKRGQLYLDTYSVPFIRTEPFVPSISSSYAVGQTVSIVDGYNNENRSLVITKIKKKFPHNYDVITAGDKEYSIAAYQQQTLDRIKRLEEDLSRNDGLLIQIIDLDFTVSPRKRYTKMQRSKIFDTFVLNHPINGLLSMGTVLDTFETGHAVNWSGSASLTLSDDAVTFREQAGSMKVISTAGSSTITLTSNTSYGNVSTYTGVNNGTPNKGTIGIWLNSPNTTAFSSITLRIGSGASDYIECSAREYRTVDGYNNFGSLSYSLYLGWNYFLFDLDNPSSVVGTPDWTICDYTRFALVETANTTFYVDYLTISKSNFIGLNGLGDRSLTIDDPKNTISGEMIYDEFAYDTEFS